MHKNFGSLDLSVSLSYVICFNLFEKKMCSVIGTTTLGMGYYTVMYGQIKGNEEETSCDDCSSDSLDKKIPLLQEKMEEV